MYLYSQYAPIPIPQLGLINAVGWYRVYELSMSMFG